MPKPYGLDKAQDLRWECLALAASAVGKMTPMEIAATAEVFADYVSRGLTLGQAAAVVEHDPASNIVRLSRQPA